MRKSTAGLRFPGKKQCVFDGCTELRWEARGVRCLEHRFNCTVPGCTSSTIQKSTGKSSGTVCWVHKQRMLKTGRYEAICGIKGCDQESVNRSSHPRCSNHRGGLNHDGYKTISVEGRRVLEHRFLMEQSLGRPLFSHENVHHINGHRADNRLENLELWSRSQPPGQRVKDKIAWAKSFLSEYGETL